MFNIDKLSLFWQEFLEATNRSPLTTYTCHFHFESNEKLANELLELVLIGQKKATASSLYAYEIEKEPLPKVGDLSIVTDWNQSPKCVIETKTVTLIPFKDITFDICKREGEDDTLKSWQNGHIKFFKAEGQKIGYIFDETMIVVFEDFEMIYKI